MLGASARPIVMQQLSSFLRAGALVFGGGHVVLPLLEQSLVPPGWLGLDQFLAGYGLAQSVPGPMFSFSAPTRAENGADRTKNDQTSAKHN